MENSDDKTNLLLDSIRNELLAIIDEGGEKFDHQNTEYKTKAATNPEVDHEAANVNNAEKVAENTDESEDDIFIPEIKNAWSSNSEKTHTESTTNRSRILKSEYSNVTEDMAEMQAKLDESYVFFQTIAKRFDSINFASLKNQIKDLKLHERAANNDDGAAIKETIENLKHTFNKVYMENRLSDLTKDVGLKFQQHPGEFGDIPELSQYFRACTQLQHGMEKLRRQRGDMEDLTRRVSSATELNYDRVNEIQELLNQKDKLNRKSSECAANL